LNEALEQQTATAEILRLISSSPTSVEAVFDTILANALRLCETPNGGIFTFDGQVFRPAAVAGFSDEFLNSLKEAVILPGPETPLRRVGLGLQVSHVADILSDPSFSPPDAYRLEGMRTALAVPMLKQGRLVGALTFHRHEVRPFTDKQIALIMTFADQAVIAIENVRLFKELETRNRDLTVALDQQTATAEVLKVISNSPTEMRPVFQAIVDSAVRLCDAAFGGLIRWDGDLMTIGAISSQTRPEERGAFEEIYPLPVTPRSRLVGLAIREKRVVQIDDVQAEPDVLSAAQNRRLVQAQGYRTFLAVPLLRGDACFGAISLWRRVVAPFSEQHIALLQTFAEQAVIAIENVRLFNETKEALEQQTATSEILGVISSSPTDIQPVFDAVAESAARLCESYDSQIWRRDGDRLFPAAHHGPIPVLPTDEFILSLGRGTISGRSVLDGRTIQVGDMQAQVEEFPEGGKLARQLGYRTILSVPLMREGVAVGAIVLRRIEARLFTERQIALLQTFADQAVIAIENVRLFNELQASNRDLTTALDKQTATSDILRVISRSQTDVQPVFDAILTSAVRLLRGYSGTLAQIAGDQIELAAYTRTGAAGDAVARDASHRPLDSEGVHARTIRDRAPMTVADLQTDPRFPERVHAFARARGLLGVITVPLLRHGEALGSIAVARREPGEFNTDEFGLLQTFADQAVIAIENVRLFKELEAANRELAAASQHKSEFLANMSHELRTPLNAVIGFSEVLSERMFGELNEKQDEYLKDIHASGQHLLSLINDILDLSKIEAGKMELELSDFDLPMTIDNALMLIRERAARRSIALNTAVDERVGQVHADERKIRQVLLNLLSNAIKFTPEGGRIHVEARSVNESIEVSVTDTGVGIAPEDQEAVFEEFRQVGTADKKVEGTGLGLALSRKFIELHGGKIWVKSQVGEGSTFTFTVPVRRGE
jgi:signal transduction histidine kinase